MNNFYFYFFLFIETSIVEKQPKYMGYFGPDVALVLEYMSSDKKKHLEKLYRLIRHINK